MTGIRVVELAVVIAGPAAAAMLGDWGAEVIKVEPLAGDPARGNQQRAYFDLDNRGKRSIGIDLKSAQGLEVLWALIERADVFVSNLREAALQRLGLGWEQLSARNPRLVGGFISGYGSGGPAGDKAGYDVGAFWSRAGVAAALAGGGAEPAVSRPGMGDHTTGLALVAGVAAALLERERTGRGGCVRTSLLRTGAYVISSDLTVRLRGGRVRTGLRRAMYNPLLACYRAGDGRWFWLLGLEAERHWPQIARAIDRPELSSDPRFATFVDLVRRSDEVIGLLDEAFARRPLAAWAEVFAREDVWWDPVQDLDEVLADPVFADSGAVGADDDGQGFVRPPVDFAGTPTPRPTVAPEAGQHTEEILLELGWDWEGIGALKELGAVL